MNPQYQPTQPTPAQPTPGSFPTPQPAQPLQSATPSSPQLQQLQQPQQFPQPQSQPTAYPPQYAAPNNTPQQPQQPQPTQPYPAQNVAPQQPTQPTAPAPKVVENPISTQSTLLISELRDNLVIMKDGSFRAVVACQSINFDLMSETEREGVEYSYQNFLNSLNFTVQVLVRSQRVDIGPYIERLNTLRRNNENMLLGVLMDDYINFIDVLSQEANIMDKSFFVVIPYYSSADAERLVNQTKNLFRGFSRKTPDVTRINRDTYNKAVDELSNRVESVVSGLFQIGIHAVRLRTRELSELYYNFNNPDTAVREPLVDFSKLATTYVRKGEKQNG